MFKNLRILRTALFRNMLQTIQTAQTGHLGACCSSIDLLSVLYFTDILKYDTTNPKHPLRDYVLLRGHLGPLRYNIFHLLGWMSESEMKQYREYGSRLQGHEDMFTTPGVDITPSGSLGMVLSYGIGAAIGFQDQQMPNRVFCFLGDGEEEEGNVSEAARHAGHLQTKNLICVIDRNGGQLSTRLKNTDGGANLEKIWSGYGWHVLTIRDGHDLEEIHAVYKTALLLSDKGPVCIVANTVKGNGIPGAKEDYNGFHVVHGSELHDVKETVREIDIESVLASLDGQADHKYFIPTQTLPAWKVKEVAEIPPIYLSADGREPTLSQYDIEAEFLRALENQVGDRLYFLSSDYPPRGFVYGSGGFHTNGSHYYNTGLREQHMTAMAHGIYSVRKDAVIVVLCGDAFLYRHMDQINALAQAKTPVIFYSVQSGLSGSKNGSTHQSSGQSGAMLLMPGVLSEEPDSAEHIIQSGNRALQFAGPSYIRLHKMRVPWDYGGKVHTGFEVVEYSDFACGTIIASGMLGGSAHEAAQRLKESGLEFNLIIATSLNSLRGISEYVSPIGPLVTLYNGDPRILELPVAAELVRDKVMVEKVIAKGFALGTTGSIKDLLQHFGLDAESIVQTCTAEHNELYALA